VQIKNYIKLNGRDSTLPRHPPYPAAPDDATSLASTSAAAPPPHTTRAASGSARDSWSTTLPLEAQAATRQEEDAKKTATTRGQQGSSLTGTLFSLLGLRRARRPLCWRSCRHVRYVVALSRLVVPSCARCLWCPIQLRGHPTFRPVQGAQQPLPRPRLETEPRALASKTVRKSEGKFGEKSCPSGKPDGRLTSAPLGLRRPPLGSRCSKRGPRDVATVALRGTT
jgi:hypothetical protein